MQIRSSKQTLIYLLAAALMILGALALCSESLRAVLAPLVGGDIDHENLVFLDAARTQSFDDTLAFGEILAALEIVQSAEVGFSFIGSASVQVGQALAGLNVALEKALMASIVGAGVYEALILTVGISSVLNLVFFQGLLIAAAMSLVSFALPIASFLKITSRLALRCAVVLFLSSYVLLPYSINVTGWLATSAPFQSSQQNAEQLSNFHAHVLADKPPKEEFGFWTQKDAVRAQYKKFEEGLPHSAEQITRHAIAIALHAFFVGLLLPLVIFLLFLWGLRRFIEDHKVIWRKIEQALLPVNKR